MDLSQTATLLGQSNSGTPKRTEVKGDLRSDRFPFSLPGNTSDQADWSGKLTKRLVWSNPQKLKVRNRTQKVSDWSGQNSLCLNCFICHQSDLPRKYDTQQLGDGVSSPTHQKKKILARPKGTPRHSPDGFSQPPAKLCTLLLKKGHPEKQRGNV